MLFDKKIRAALISVAVNLVLVGVKLWGASFSRSMGLHADALHSLSDVGVSLLVLLGAVSAWKARKSARIVEEVTAVVIGLLIVGVGVRALASAGAGMAGRELEEIPAALVLTWFCVVVTHFVAAYKIRVGRECNAASLQADGHHSRMDMYSSLAVLVGLLGAWCGLNLDAVASLAVGLLIMRIGVVVLVATANSVHRRDLHVAQALGDLESRSAWRALPAFCERRLGLRTGALGAWGAEVRNWFGPRRWAVLGTLAGIAVVAYALSGVYRIGPGEVGVLTRFGRLRDGAVEPGLHYRLPPPFTTVYRTAPSRARQLEFGFRTVGQRGVTEEPSMYLWESQHLMGIYEKRLEEAIVLTGDKNEVDLNFVLEYRLIREALPRYLFRTADADAFVRALAQRCVQRAVGCMELEAVLTTGRTEIEGQVGALLQDLLDELGLGVEVAAVRLQDVHPPGKVVPAFRAVATAREQRETLIHQAEAYRNDMVPKARGQGAFLRRDAEAHNAEKRLWAEGDAAYFDALAAVYRDYPEAARFVRHVSTLEEVMAGTRKVVLDGRVGVRGDGSTLPEWFMAAEFLNGPSAPIGTGDGFTAAEEVTGANQGKWIQ